MSKPNVKPRPPEAPAKAPAPAPTSAAAELATAVVQPEAPAAPKAPADEHRGRGGLYTMKDGERVLVQRTETAQPDNNLKGKTK